ncbi:MAG TPA: TetR/AcrR family transcriptional regulator [Kribbella sp.]|jgi:AcrR family transcriptional regulator
MAEGLAAAAPRLLRSDSLRTRERLLDAAAELLRRKGTAFTLPELARESGLSTATTYRHFDDVHAVFDAYYGRILGDLIDRFEAAATDAEPIKAFDNICRVWARGAVEWGRAATHIRSAEGFLERAARGDDPMLLKLFSTLSVTVRDLVDAGAVPEVDIDYAVLMWVTIFDERVVVDLVETLGWTAERIGRTLGGSVLGSWSRQELHST